ncbi:hypothetical protein [Caulobacter phage KcrB]|nr:hypothetical protein RW_GP008c [Caulobacter phage RW]WCA46312.1 hypothetical protein [Caulobacter phage KcrB]WCD56247.1 hypothetical protein [Caulobacter phage RLK]WNV48039.1 hypothetical protein GB2A_gp007c [Caulobacter phage GB2A]QDH50465.1 hypothetical protein RW_GP104c [Caulobacter phage RW]
MAGSIKRQPEKARAKRDTACERVFAAALPRRDVRFWDCYLMADDATRAAYDAASEKVSDLELQAIMSNKAYRAPGGLLVFYR